MTGSHNFQPPQWYIHKSNRVVYQPGGYDRPGLLQILGRIVMGLGKLVYNPDAEPQIQSGSNPQLGESAPIDEPETFEEDTEINWAEVEIGFLAAKQDLGAKTGVLAGTALTIISGPVEKQVHELSDGKAHFHVVSERTLPEWYDNITEELGFRPTKFGMFVLVGKQPLGLLKGVVASKIEQKIEPVVEAKLPIHVILERQNPQQYAALKAALQSKPEAYGRGGEGLNIKAALLEGLRESQGPLAEAIAENVGGAIDKKFADKLPDDAVVAIKAIHERHQSNDEGEDPYQEHKQNGIAATLVLLVIERIGSGIRKRIRERSNK